ncbi:MAG TPA: ABC transporter substrate-binding protein, partial [Chloroflexota bacterium]|nr:ABC transporter substrate-binding protein [Chloroflexota bacterium]
MTWIARAAFVRLASMATVGIVVAACGGGAAPAGGGSGSATQAAVQPTTAPASAAKPTAAAGSGATAAPAAAQAATKSSKDTLTIVFPSNQGSLDGHFAATNQELLVTRNIYSSLLKYKPDTTEIVGDLATSWETAPDGLTYTFKLRQDVEWQKGFGHFTAADVKGSFDRLKASETKSPFAGSISMLKEVQVVDDYTVKFLLNEPYAAFPHLLTNYRAGPIVNVKAVQQFGKDYDWNPVGTGPYQFESGIPKQEAIVTAFDKYFGGAPPIKKVITRTVPDMNAEVVGLENGQYDMLYVAPDDPAVVKRLTDKGFVRAAFSRNLPEVLLMNVTVKPFDDLKVRQAIAYAVDRQQLIDLAYPGVGKPWYGPVPEGFFGASTDLPKMDHDVAKAKQLLSEAGYPNGLDVTLNVYDTQKLASDVLLEQLKAVGIRATEEALDQPTFIGRVIQNQGINFALHCCVRQPDADIILSDMFSPKLRGAIYVSHADLESDLATARKELDPAKRQQLYVDLQKRIINEVLMVPVAMINDRSMATGT